MTERSTNDEEFTSSGKSHCLQLNLRSFKFCDEDLQASHSLPQPTYHRIQDHLRKVQIGAAVAVAFWDEELYAGLKWISQVRVMIMGMLDWWE